MPLLTLQNISLAFGHLPLLEDATLQIDAGERVALIGRNGSGKSSLLRVIAGEIPADGGVVWRSPGLRLSRLDQDVPLAGDRSVFDEVADGLGELGALVAAYHHAAMDVATAADPGSEARDAGSEDPALRSGPVDGRAGSSDPAMRSGRVGGSLVDGRAESPDPAMRSGRVGGSPVDGRAGSSDPARRSGPVGGSPVDGRAGSSDPAMMIARLGDLQHALEERDGWRLEQKVEMVVSRLALPADRSLRDLSGGWRRRTLLGKALVSNPDLLLLDEPTNHLDIDAIRWLEEYLRGYSGALLFVTHDRAFLGALATRIIELDRGTLTSWPGSYGSYLDKKADALETEARDLARLDKKLAQEEAWLRQGVKARRTRNEGRVKALHALRAERAAYRAQSGTVRMGIDGGEASGRVAFEAERVHKSFDGVPIVREYSHRILRGDRIGLIGPNGSGKTTLLRLLVGELEPDEGTIRRGTRLQIAYFDQQRQQLDPDRTVADSVSDSSTVIVNGQPRHVIGYLADFLFPRERAQSPVRSLSGGERNRLMLARLFAKPANVLVMDEPTNDLDIETLELLEDLIAEFDGTVLLVSHDRVFLDNIVTSTLAFEGHGRVAEYVGGYEDYLRQSRGPGSGVRDPMPVKPRTPEQRLRPERGAKSPSESERGWGPASAEKSGQEVGKKKLSYMERRELASLPAHIDALEAEQQRLRAESESAEFYKEPPDHIRAVLSRIEALDGEIEAALARWMELEERQP